jgi:hypothetical protein
MLPSLFCTPIINGDPSYFYSRLTYHSPAQTEGVQGISGCVGELTSCRSSRQEDCLDDCREVVTAHGPSPQLCGLGYFHPPSSLGYYMVRIEEPKKASTPLLEANDMGPSVQGPLVGWS